MVNVCVCILSVCVCVCVCVCETGPCIMSSQRWRSSSSEHAASCCLPQVSSSPCCCCVAVAMLRRSKKRRRPEISAPRDFQHRVHTSFDAATGRYVGLPPQWQSVIDTLRRPRPLVDPSRVTEVELRKVRWGYGTNSVTNQYISFQRHMFHLLANMTHIAAVTVLTHATLTSFQR